MSCQTYLGRHYYSCILFTYICVGFFDTYQVKR